MEALTPDDPRAIAGYRLHARLGAGGMGRVYLGTSPGGRSVAVKVVRPGLADDEEFRSRFRREVVLARRVRGFCTAPVVDADPDAPVPWLATVYVPGPSLQEAVTACGPLPAATVRTLTAGLAEALAALHADGVVHRDLKPSNVLLPRDGPRLVDFGIARAADGANTTLTRAGVLVGSPGFMAPEQVSGGATGPAVDIFGLGATLVYAATGRGPFGDGAAHAVLYRVVRQPPELAGVPESLLDLVARCLAKDPAARPDAATVLREVNGSERDGSGGWLPARVAALAEQRETMLLTLPLPVGRAAATPATPATPAGRAASPPVGSPPALPLAPVPPSARSGSGSAGGASAARTKADPYAVNPYAVNPYAVNPYAVRPAPRPDPRLAAPADKAAGPPGRAHPTGPFRYGRYPWPRNGLGNASLALGLFGILCFWGLGVSLGLAGALCGLLGIRRVRRGEATNRPVALAGVVTSVVAVLISLSFLHGSGA